MQDVHDTAERLGIEKDEGPLGSMGTQLSGWEDLPELKHLQLLFAEHPYWGRQLRYFNQAPWWYKYDFSVPLDAGRHAKLTITNADYYCKVWLNGTYLGSHEGYATAFSFPVDSIVNRGGNNTLLLKIWSPWDTEVKDGQYDKRTFAVMRNLIKGTYEHSDTFVQRDVNPVGLYGGASLECCDEASFLDDPKISYVLKDGLRAADLSVLVRVVNTDGRSYMLCLECTDKFTKERSLLSRVAVDGDGEYLMRAMVEDICIWDTWDRGDQYLYDIGVYLEEQGNKKKVCEWERRIGFREVKLVRDGNQTTFILNGKRFYMRGTAYFPDVYISAMSAARYKRDLLAIKASGFNSVRVHVHVEKREFYEFCSELGIAVLQDSDYNWTMPEDVGFARRFVETYLCSIELLRDYPSIICWICMNEPQRQKVENSRGEVKYLSPAMDKSPGPDLFAAVSVADPSRPIIKGSFCADDPDSGDSHNYLGSLNGEATHYRDIYGTTEKLNTEYGFDCPPCTDDLKKAPLLYKRLAPIADRFGEIGHYQYALLKYYTEHYRMQKYSPNSGYVQFLFNDIGPQSFYGIFDWWGLPKEGLDAMLESNMPQGIFLKYDKKPDSIYAVNDSLSSLGKCEVRWNFVDVDGARIIHGERLIDLGPDTIIRVEDLSSCPPLKGRVDVSLILLKEGRIVCSNHYEDFLSMPEHIQGHPSRIDHELGMRLYFA